MKTKTKASQVKKTMAESVSFSLDFFLARKRRARNDKESSTFTVDFSPIYFKVEIVNKTFVRILE
jgi:hypothetical protein